MEKGFFSFFFFVWIYTMMRRIYIYIYGIGRDDFSVIFLFHWYNLFEIFLREKFWVNVVEL